MYKLIMSINNNEEYIVFPAVPAGIGPQYESGLFNACGLAASMSRTTALFRG